MMVVAMVVGDGYGCWLWSWVMVVGYGCWLWVLDMGVGCGCWLVFMVVKCLVMM